jgi:putative peptidoglycan lipid II flippase
MTAPKRSRLLRASAVSAVATALSRVTGAARDISLANAFGAGQVSDAFWLAFTIPGIFRRFLADEGLTGALIPAVANAERGEGAAAAKRLADEAFAALFALGLALTVVGMVFARELVLTFGSGFKDDTAQLELTVGLTRWMMPSVLLVTLVSYAEGLMNYRGAFFWPKVAPSAANLAMVAAALWPLTWLGAPVYTVVLGVLVGGVLQVLMCLPALLRSWGPIGFVWPSFANVRLRAFLREMSKVAAIGVFAQVNVIVLRNLGSLLETGTITQYWYASRIVDLAQGAVAVGVSSALLPAVSHAAAERDWDRFRADLAHAFALAGIVLVPVAGALAVVARPIVSLLFLHGAYTASDVARTALAVELLVPFMLALSGINLVKKAFFAIDDRNSLFAVGALGVAITALLGWALARPLGVAGLSLALSVSTCVQLAVYLLVLRKRIEGGLGLGAVVGPLLRMALATVPAMILARAICSLGDWDRGALDLRNDAIFVAAAALSGLVYVALANLLHVEELREVIDRIRHRLGR